MPVYSTGAARKNSVGWKLVDHHLQKVELHKQLPVNGTNGQDTTPLSTNAPPLVVLIPTGRRPQHLRVTLESISRSRIPESLASVFVVENGPRCGADSVAAEFSGILPIEYRYVPTGNKSLALNDAIENMEGDPLIVFFDDDVTVSPECLVAYSEAAGRLPYRAYLGGPVSVAGRTPRTPSSNDRLPLSVTGLVYNGSLGYSKPDIFFLGSNWAAHRQLLIAAGLFDVRFGPGATTGATGQETMMQINLRRDSVAGFYVPRAAVMHHPPDQNFTFRWLMHRKYRNGIAKGLQYPVMREEALYILVQILANCARIAFYLLSWQKEKLVDALSAIFQILGRIRGSSFSKL